MIVLDLQARQKRGNGYVKLTRFCNYYVIPPPALALNVQARQYMLCNIYIVLVLCTFYHIMGSNWYQPAWRAAAWAHEVGVWLAMAMVPIFPTQTNSDALVQVVDNARVRSGLVPAFIAPNSSLLSMIHAIHVSHLTRYATMKVW